MSHGQQILALSSLQRHGGDQLYEPSATRRKQMISGLWA